MKKIAIVAAVVVILFFIVAYVKNLESTSSNAAPYPMNKADYLNKMNGSIASILTRQETNMTNVMQIMKGSMSASEEASIMESTIAYEDAVINEIKSYYAPASYDKHTEEVISKIRESKSTLRKCIDLLNDSKKVDTNSILNYLEIDFAALKTLHTTAF